MYFLNKKFLSNLLKASRKIVSVSINQYYYIYFKLIDVEFDNMPQISNRIIIMKIGRIILGSNIYFNSHYRSNLAGIYKPCSIAVLKNAVLQIGNNCGFSGCSIFCASKITIGDYCNFGVNTSIWDTDFHPVDNYISRRNNVRDDIITKPIIIGNDVFVGANSVILKGVKIGNGAVVGANSVVTTNIPSNEIWAGNPARYIRKIRDQFN